MTHFDCDYMRGAHPEVLERLVATNMEQTPGYGLDDHTRRAEALILRLCGLDGGEVRFLTGGTQANATVIDALAGRCEGIICTPDSHINVHEAGAIEAAGHKVIPLQADDGKLQAATLERCLDDFYADATWPHMVIPGMVYISHPTELGTLYSLDELEQLSEVCRRRGLPLYLDGARLVYGLAARTDITLRDIGRLCDAFYIGGTKAGTLFGEAVVLTPRARVRNFFTQVKNHGALLAKGRLAAIQFLALFEGDLWQRLGRNAIDRAMELREAMTARGYPLLFDSPTNQQFFLIPNEKLGTLRRAATFDLWGAPGATHTAIRLVTDWSTTPEEIRAFLSALPPAESSPA